MTQHINTKEMMPIKTSRRSFLKQSIGMLSLASLSMLSISVKSNANNAIVNLKNTIRKILNIDEQAQLGYRNLLINQKVIGETLKSEIGDQMQITINNHLNEPTLMHWHGLLIPNNQDGTSVSTADILSKSSFEYHLPIKQQGTYWYHSHYGLQEQEGLYGAIIIEDNLQTKYGYTKDHVVMLSDKVFDTTDHVEAILKSGRSYSPDQRNLVHKVDNKEMHSSHSMSQPMSQPGMNHEMMMQTCADDGADVIYDAYLVNGQSETQTFAAPAHSWQRLRIINAGASTYFRLIADDLFILIATDGLPVKPVASSQLLITNGETYDILIKTPEMGMKKIIVAAVGQDKQTEIHLTASSEKPVASMQHEIQYTKQLDEITDVQQLEQDKIAFPIAQASKNAPIKQIDLRLTGSMMPFSWSFNDITADKAEIIKINRGDRVQVRLINTTMMSHPIHLHGHFFKVIKEDGDYGIYKHTINVPVMKTVTIEFDAVEDSGKWLLHCHNLYHMKSGMLRVIEY